MNHQTLKKLVTEHLRVKHPAWYLRVDDDMWLFPGVLGDYEFYLDKDDWGFILGERGSGKTKTVRISEKVMYLDNILCWDIVRREIDTAIKGPEVQAQEKIPEEWGEVCP